jgi:hypothetical protein
MFKQAQREAAASVKRIECWEDSLAWLSPASALAGCKTKNRRTLGLQIKWIWLLGAKRKCAPLPSLARSLRIVRFDAQVLFFVGSTRIVFRNLASS